MEPPADPIAFFLELFSRFETYGAPEPRAMALATAAVDGTPSVRTVLFKEFDESGCVFYTNLNSRKAEELRSNPKAALCFYWEVIQYQVRVSGRVSQVAGADADAYFASRPRGSQIGAWASRQSSVLDGRNELEQQVARYEARFKDVPVPRPEFWSGFRVTPETIEFWRRQENRLHERTLYSRTASGWDVRLLYP